MNILQSFGFRTGAPAVNHGTIGIETVLGSQITMGNGKACGTRVYLPEPGALYRITAYLQAGAGSNTKAALYGDNAAAGEADESNCYGVTPAGTVTNTWAWYDFDFASPIDLTPGFYWLLALSDNGTNVKYASGQPEGNYFLYNGNITYTDGTDLSGGQYYDNFAMSIYGTY